MRKEQTVNYADANTRICPSFKVIQYQKQKTKIPSKTGIVYCFKALACHSSTLTESKNLTLLQFSFQDKSGPPLPEVCLPQIPSVGLQVTQEDELFLPTVKYSKFFLVSGMF